MAARICLLHCALQAGSSPVNRASVEELFEACAKKHATYTYHHLDSNISPVHGKPQKTTPHTYTPSKQELFQGNFMETLPKIISCLTSAPVPLLRTGWA